MTDEEIEDHIGFEQISNSLKDVKENTEVIELANWQKLKLIDRTKNLSKFQNVHKIFTKHFKFLT